MNKRGKKYLFCFAMVAMVAVISISMLRIINSQVTIKHEPTEGDFEESPVVYMTKDISSKGLIAAYDALERAAYGNVGVKISIGQPGGNNYLKPDLIKDLVQKVNGVIVETNTAFKGRRASTDSHMEVADEHGFFDIAPIDILDSEGSIELPVIKGSRISKNIVGSHFNNYDFHIVLSHFKGHEMAGFGGALKNISIGYAAPRGKRRIHNGGYGESTMANYLLYLLGDQNAFLEAMAEAAGTIIDDAGDNILYINVMNKLSVDCDCSPNPAEPDMHDIGILASLDPVALDKACVDLIYSAPDGNSIVERIESCNGLHLLEYAHKIGLGDIEYRLVNID